MYKYKEVRCPKCNHIFVWLEQPQGNSYCLYRRKGYEEEMFSTTCPNCSLEMVIPSESHNGIDIRDDMVEQFATLRGL